MNSNNLVELFKPRIAFMQIVTVFLGYLLGSGGSLSVSVSLLLCFGTVLVSSGSAALNNCIEIEKDALMERTKNRVLPSGLLTLKSGVFLGLLPIILGGYLLALINQTVFSLGILTVVFYIFIYTPSKRLTWLNTFIGAVPGALPPLGGWAAAQSLSNQTPWLLFGLLFCWQIPHFFAIAWMYKEDYQKAGFKMLPPSPNQEKYTFYLINFFTIILVGITFWLGYYLTLGILFFIGNFVATYVLVKPVVRFNRDHSKELAKKVIIGSVIYLPIITGTLFLELLL